MSTKMPKFPRQHPTAGTATNLPKVAVYGQHGSAPTSEALQQRGRERLAMLQQQHKAASGKAPAFTASSFHPPSSNQQHRADPNATAPAVSAVPAGVSNVPITPAYVENLQEQRSVLEDQVQMYREREELLAKQASNAELAARAGGAGVDPKKRGVSATKKGAAPASVETHNTNLMEVLRQEHQQQREQAFRSKKQLLEKEGAEHEYRQELHSLRTVAAHEREAAAEAQREKDAALHARAASDAKREQQDRSLTNLQQRFDFVLEELNFVKGELDVARSEASRRLEYPSATFAAGAAGGMGPDGEPLSGAQALAAENESLKAQLAESQSWLQQRDQMMDDQNAAAEAKAKELRTTVDALRHEQQRYQLLAASAESTKVKMQDAESEVQYLRVANAALQEDVKRLTRQTDELFSKIKTEMETRQIRDAQVNTTLESTKALQVESERVHTALVAEQGINQQLRSENESLRRTVDEANLRNTQCREQYEALQRSLTDVQSRYNARTTELEEQMNRWKQMQARQASTERQYMAMTGQLLDDMKVDVATGAAVAHATSRPVSPAAVDVSTTGAVPVMVSATGAVPVAAPVAPAVISPNVSTAEYMNLSNVSVGGAAAPQPPAPAALATSQPISPAVPTCFQPIVVPQATVTVMPQQQQQLGLVHSRPVSPQRPLSAVDQAVIAGRERSAEVRNLEHQAHAVMAHEQLQRRDADEVKMLARKALAAVAADIPPPPPNPPA